jgi:beta-lactam-binding protein with PASTA domain
VPLPAGEPAAGGDGQERPGRGRSRLLLVAVAALAAALVVAGGMAVGRLTEVPTVRVPQVVGMSQAEAMASLAARGLRGNVAGTATSGTVPQGDVVAADPPPGSLVKQGRTVNLTISLGPAFLQGGVPDVTGLTQDEADAVLRGAGLVPEFGNQFSAQVPKGEVIATDPPAHAPARQGDSVLVEVSQGPPPQPLAMPQLVGQLLADARNALQAAGLQLGSISQQKSDYPSGVVVATDPPAGASVLPGQSVNLTVSSGCANAATLQVTVPRTATPPVTLLVTVTDQAPQPHTAYQGQVPPGATVTVQSVCWVGPGARWTAYANGQAFASGTLPQPGGNGP